MRDKEKETDKSVSFSYKRALLYFKVIKQLRVLDHFMDTIIIYAKSHICYNELASADRFSSVMDALKENDLGKRQQTK